MSNPQLEPPRDGFSSQTKCQWVLAYNSGNLRDSRSGGRTANGAKRWSQG